MDGQDHVKPIEPVARPLEAVISAAAMEIDDWPTLARAVDNRTDAVDEVLVTPEAGGAVGECGADHGVTRPAFSRASVRIAGTRSVFLLAPPGSGLTIFAADVVIVEVAELLGGALLFHVTLQPSPRRIGDLRSTALHGLEVLDQMIDVEILGLLRRLFGLVLFKFVRLAFLAHRYVPSRISNTHGGSRRARL